MTPHTKTSRNSSRASSILCPTRKSSKSSRESCRSDRLPGGSSRQPRRLPRYSRLRLSIRRRSSLGFCKRSSKPAPQISTSLAVHTARSLVRCRLSPQRAGSARDAINALRNNMEIAQNADGTDRSSPCRTDTTTANLAGQSSTRSRRRKSRRSPLATPTSYRKPSNPPCGTTRVHASSGHDSFLNCGRTQPTGSRTQVRPPSSSSPSTNDSAHTEPPYPNEPVVTVPRLEPSHSDLKAESFAADAIETQHADLATPAENSIPSSENSPTAAGSARDA